MLEKTLKIPLDSKEIKLVNPEGGQGRSGWHTIHSLHEKIWTNFCFVLFDFGNQS